MNMTRRNFSLASWTLAQEGRAMLTRLARVKPFALQETMLPAAAPTNDAQAALEAHLDKLRHDLEHKLSQFSRWIEGRAGAEASPEEAQRRFTFLRLEFNRVLSHVDIFSEALSQRSEADTGLWLSGLEVVARDALDLPGYFSAPPVLCYLARGAGAAIRRARTRLPGGGENPVAIIRMPRERMIGSGLSSSLIHEVGHQGVALLDLLPALRRSLSEARPESPRHALAWDLWSRWISEILADLWAVAKVGITATMGLIGVVSLPRAFVFRSNGDDPHPMPWMRVRLSAALGQALYPDPQWGRLCSLWESYYPIDRLPSEQRELIAALDATMAAFIDHILEHRPERLLLRTLRGVLASDSRAPERLRGLYRLWRKAPALGQKAAPSLFFAVIGQARSDGEISVEKESEVLERALRFWALQTSTDEARAHGLRPQRRRLPPISAMTYPANAAH
jgi:hypothetical protein